MIEKPKTAQELLEELEDLHQQEDQVMDQLKELIGGSDDFDDFMEICRKAREIWGNSFTYTLLESKDIV